MSAVDSLLAVIGAIAVTYLIHSTLLLSITWCLGRRRFFGLAVCEQIWKSAAVTGFMSSVFQVAFIGAYPELGSGPLRLNLGQVERLESDGQSLAYYPDHLPARIGRGVEHQDVDRKREQPLRSAGRGVTGTLSERVIIPPREATRLPSPSLAGVHDDETPSLQWGEARNAGYSRRMEPIAFHAVATAAFVLLCSGFGRAGIQLLSLRRRYCHLEVVTHRPALRSLEAILRRNAIRTRVQLVVDDRTSEPFAFGFFRWTIVLPEQLLRHLESKELEALLAHEVAHLVRGDFWWLWIGKLLCCCLPFQPLNLVARRRWQAAAEHLCDEWAVEHGVERVSLARCLVRVAEWQMEPTRGLVLYATGRNEATVALRVRRLLKPKPSQPTSRSLLRFVKTGAAALGCVLVIFGPGVALPIKNSTAVTSIDSIRDRHEKSPHPAALQQWRSLEDDLRRLDEQFATLHAIVESAELDASARKVAAGIQLHYDRLRCQRDRLNKVMRSSR